MKIKIFALLVLLAFLIGCGQQGEAPVEKTGEEPAQPAEEAAEEPLETTEEPTAEEPSAETKEMTDDVKELLAKASKKVKSYSYYHYGPETGQLSYHLFAKGNKTKIIPPERVKVRENEFYDTIYLNTETKTALAYCESLDTLICPDTSKEFKLSYNGTYIKTPLDWLNEIEYAERLSEETMQDRKTIKLDSDEVGTVWIEDYYGIPFQLEKDGKNYRFETMIFNQVKDSDVMR